MVDSILESIGKALIPKKLRPDLRKYLAKAGYFEVPYSSFGVSFFVIMIIFYPLFVTQVLPSFKDLGVGVSFVYYFLSAAGILLVLAAVVMLVFHFYWNMKIYHRTKELERILPDYLTLVSTNLKGGAAFERALWDAIKPEFGVLASEIGLVSKKVMTGNNLVDALDEFVMKYDSPILQRNFQLITSEFEAGGKITLVIDRIIVNMKKTQLLKKELVASTVTYMMFITSLVVVICPALFALSFQLFGLIQHFMGSLGGSSSAMQTAIQLSAPEVEAGDFRMFSILAIVVISVGSSCISSVIEKGDLSSVIKYAPLYTVLSVIVYFISSIILAGLFSSIM